MHARVVLGAGTGVLFFREVHSSGVSLYYREVRIHIYSMLHTYLCIYVCTLYIPVYVSIVCVAGVSPSLNVELFLWVVH